MKSTPGRRAIEAAALAALVACAVALSLGWARAPGQAAFVWVANGICVGWLLARPSERWTSLLAAATIAEVLARQWFTAHMAFGLGLSAANLLEILIVATTVRRHVPDLDDPRGWLALGAIATGSTLVACALSAVIAASLFFYGLGSSFTPALLTWYAAHTVGMVIVATLTVVLHRERLVVHGLRARMDFLGVMALLAAVSLAVFAQSRYPLLFLTYPPLLWGAFRHRFLGVVAGITLLALIGGGLTVLGHGPLVALNVQSTSVSERTLMLQVFLGVGCLMTFPVALAMAQRGRLLTRLRVEEQRYRLLADYTHDVVLRVDAGGHCGYASPSSADALGWPCDALVGRPLEIVHPDDRSTWDAMLAAACASAGAEVRTLRLRHRDGQDLWFEVAARCIERADARDGGNVILAARDVTRRVDMEQALRASQQELDLLARTDGLTGLANRRQFDERIAYALVRAGRNRTPLALLLADVDHFKSVNDGHGHAVGDAVLRAVADRLRRTVRAGDLVARLGGDEFVVLIDDAAVPEAAVAVARKLIAAMNEPVVPPDGASLIVTTSIGIAFATAPTGAEALLRAADAALYRAKDGGRARFVLACSDDKPAAN